MRRIWLYGALIAVAAGLLVSTSGFTAMSAERPVTVAVADNENAILGIETLDASGTVGETVAVLKITNNFDHEITVTVESDGIDNSSTLTSGESWTVSVDCADSTATFDIDAGGSGVHVTTSETVSMNCTPVTTQTTTTSTTTTTT